MYLGKKSPKISNRDSLTRAATEIKADVKNYINSFCANLENNNPELKTKISKNLVFQERQLTQYVKRVVDSSANLTQLKKIFRLIGGKYLKSDLSLADLTLLSQTFLQTLEIYLGSFENLASKQKIYLTYQTIFTEILAGAKERYSLWHENSENVSSCVKRMKIEAIIQRTLARSDSNEELVIHSRLLNNGYFQKSLQKIGKQKTLELITSAIEIVNKKSKS